MTRTLKTLFSSTMFFPILIMASATTAATPRSFPQHRGNGGTFPEGGIKKGNDRDYYQRRKHRAKIVKNAPGIPARRYPIRMDALIAIGPGADCEIATRSSISFSLSFVLLDKLFPHQRYYHISSANVNALSVKVDMNSCIKNMKPFSSPPIYLRNLSIYIHDLINYTTFIQKIKLPNAVILLTGGTVLVVYPSYRKNRPSGLPLDCCYNL
jgi:hypothetical protein